MTHFMAWLWCRRRAAEARWLWLPLVLIFAIFYFLLIMPQQRRQKKWQAMLGELKTGDRVATSGGLRGTSWRCATITFTCAFRPTICGWKCSRASIVSVSSGEEVQK